MALFPNVRSVRDPADTWTTLLESDYLHAFFGRLQNLDPALFASLEFEVLHFNSSSGPPPVLAGGPRKVLLWLSDEASYVPVELSAKYLLILKSYWLSESPTANIHPFPLCGSNEVNAHAVIPFSARTTDVFFSGNLAPNRSEFLRSFTPLRRLPPFQLNWYPLRRVYYEVLRRVIRSRDFSRQFHSSSIRFTTGFRQGLPAQAFATALASARIALCPEGFRSKETIRMFEAWRLGCVPVCPPMPPNRFYQGAPLVEVRSWSDLRGVLGRLLGDRERLYNLHQHALQWWEDVCSSQAMASYTRDALESKLG